MYTMAQDVHSKAGLEGTPLPLVLPPLGKGFSPGRVLGKECGGFLTLS